MMNMIVEKLPELAQAFATQLSGIDKSNVIDMGGGGSGGGMGKAMATVGGGMTAMFAILKDQFGIDVAHLMQGKPDAVPEHVASEVVVAFDESEERKKTVREAPFARNGASHA